MTKNAFRGWLARGGTRPIIKTLLVMKLTVFLLTAACLNLAAKGVSQNVTFSGKNVSLEKVFAVVKQQTGYFFWYKANDLALAKPVSVEAAEQPLLQFLEQIFNGQPLKYTIESKTINIFPSVPRERTVHAGLDPQFVPIRIRVTDAEGNPLHGASVTNKKSNTSGITNDAGIVSLNVSVGDVLSVSFIGFDPLEHKVSASDEQSSNVLSIILKRHIASMESIVVNKGYYKESRLTTTGNIGTVKADIIEKQPVNNPLLALQGRVSGVTVVQNSGIPGGGITVRIQGRNSIRSGNDPLYIVDGVPLMSQLPDMGESGILGNSGVVADRAPVGAGNPLSFLNPTDIESIDVLKDADATAIYGSRAANGAILITTKSGRIGKMRVDINAQNGWSSMPDRLKVLNTRQYLDMRYEAFKNDNIDWRDSRVSADDLKVWDTTRYTDWQKELLDGVSSFSTASISLSGGVSSTKYLINPSC